MNQEDHTEWKEDLQLKAACSTCGSSLNEGVHNHSESCEEQTVPPRAQDKGASSDPVASEAGFAARVRSGHGDLSAFPILSADEVVQSRTDNSGLNRNLVLMVALLCMGWLVFKISQQQMFNYTQPSNVASEAVSVLKSVSTPTTGAAAVQPYMSRLQRQIKRHWYPPKGDESRRIVAMFKAHTDGSISHLRLSRPCGTKAADQAALNAVAEAAPFARLPAYLGESVDIEFTFDYNVDKKSTSGKTP